MFPTYVHWLPYTNKSFQETYNKLLILESMNSMDALIGAWFQSLVWPSLALRSVISSSSNDSDCDIDRYLASER